MGGGGKGGGGSTTTVQKADPWEGQQPYLTGSAGQTVLKAGAKGTVRTDSSGNVLNDANGNPIVDYQASDYETTGGTPGVFTEAARLYSNGDMAPAYYSGNTVAPQSDWTQQALQLQANRALNGSQVINDATGSVQDVLNGAGLSGNQGLQTLNQLSSEDNPYVDALYNRANSQVQSNLNSQFNRAGRYGSGAHEAAAADAANNLANEMYGGLWDKRASAAQSAGQLYNQGIGQQVAAAQTAQQLGNQAYTDAAALSEAGGVQDDYQQQLINADIDRYNYDANRALTALGNYNSMIQGNYGGTTTTTGKQETGKTSRLGNVAGGAMTGASIGTSIMPGWGTAIGAVGGGLLGLIK